MTAPVPRLLLLTAVIAVVAVPVAQARSARLHAFRSCAELVAYARAHTAPSGPKRVNPAVAPMPAPTPTGAGGPIESATGTDGAPGVPGGTDPSGAAGQSDASGTNVQEAGIDEPDVVKSDGTTLFAVSGGTLYAVDARADTPRILSSVKLEGTDQQLLLHDGRLLVLARAGATPVPVGVGDGPASRPTAKAATVVAPASTETVISEIDARDPSAMRVVQTMRAPGEYVDARQKDATARVVISAAPTVTPDEPVRMPVVQIAAGTKRGGTARRLVACNAVRRPVTYNGLGLLTVLTIDMNRGLPAVDSDAVMTDAQVVYGSPTSLYVATGEPSGGTAVHRFDTSDPGMTSYRASGELPGELLNQYSLSEQDGRLRAATTDATGGQSYVSVLSEQAGRLVTVGKVGDLGQGQRIYAVRFVGNTGYVVTFRQMDPLYTVDLSDPANPHVAGQLEIAGYSAYLHPVGDGLLLGVGQDADSQGHALGTQLSLFDVSDPANPTRLQHVTLAPATSSEAEFDPHAFLWWGPKALAVVPVRQPSFVGALGFKVARDGITEAGKVAHTIGTSQVDIERSAVVGDRLFTVSAAGVKASALDGLADQAFVAFPGASASPPPVVPAIR